MNTFDRFQRLREEIDSQNILDTLIDYLCEEDLQEFCNYLEDEFEITYEGTDYEEY